MGRTLTSRAAAAAAALLLTGALGACGESGDTASSGDDSTDTTSSGSATASASASSKTDLCSLLTPEDIEAEFGGDYGKGESNTANQCQWKTADGAANVNITKSPTDFTTSFNALKSAGTPLTEVSGVGEKAYFFKSSVVVQLGVGVKGATYVFGYGGDIVDAKIQAQMTAIAKKAVAKI